MEFTNRKQVEAYLADLTKWLATHERTASTRMIILTEQEQRRCQEWLEREKLAGVK